MNREETHLTDTAAAAFHKIWSLEEEIRDKKREITILNGTGAGIRLLGMLLVVVGVVYIAFGAAIFFADVSPEAPIGDYRSGAIECILDGLPFFIGGWILEWYGLRARKNVQGKIDALKQEICKLEAEQREWQQIYGEHIRDQQKLLEEEIAARRRGEKS